MTKQPTTAGTSTATRAQRGRRHHTAIGAALVVVLATLGMTGTAAAAPTGGNAPAAKACQKDGYRSLARAESPTVGFTSSDECTSYAAEGGTLTPLRTVNLEAMREACEAIDRAHYSGYIIDGPGTVSFSCYHPTLNGYEATFQAACEEMNGTFTYNEWTYHGYADGFRASCGGIPRPS